MQLPTFLSAVSSVLGFATLISAQAGSTTYAVSDCDGTTNLNNYSGTAATIAQPTCYTWTDPGFAVSSIQNDAEGFTCEMVVYADPNCQVDATLYPSGCYNNIGSFAILCSATPAS